MNIAGSTSNESYFKLDFREPYVADHLSTNMRLSRGEAKEYFFYS